jgi:hypothetical protein
VPEKLAICKSGQPTQDGSNSSNSKANSSLTQPMIRFLKSNNQLMKKVKLSELLAETEKLTKDGRLFILIKLMQ